MTDNTLLDVFLQVHKNINKDETMYVRNQEAAEFHITRVNCGTDRLMIEYYPENEKPMTCIGTDYKNRNTGAASWIEFVCWNTHVKLDSTGWFIADKPVNGVSIDWKKAMNKKTYHFTIEANCLVKYSGTIEAESLEEAKRIVKKEEGEHWYQYEFKEIDFDNDTLEFEEENDD